MRRETEHAGDVPVRLRMRLIGTHLTSPLSEKQRALRGKGLQMKIEGKIPKDTKVARVAKGQYVELAREGEDSIWT
ncbi:MAG: hypothetical protein ACRDNE_13380, partial [Gaiellaceae bacterium]